MCSNAPETGAASVHQYPWQTVFTFLVMHTKRITILKFWTSMYVYNPTSHARDTKHDRVVIV